MTADKAKRWIKEIQWFAEDKPLWHFNPSSKKWSKWNKNEDLYFDSLNTRTNELNMRLREDENFRDTIESSYRGYPGKQAWAAMDSNKGLLDRLGVWLFNKEF